MRPVLLQHLPTERIDFHLPPNFKPRALEAEIETANGMPAKRLPTVSGFTGDLPLSETAQRIALP